MEPANGSPVAQLAVRLSTGATGLISVGRRHAPGAVQRVWAVGTAGAADIAYIACSDDPAMVRAFRAQTEAFARAARGAGGGDLATTDDAIAALTAAELAKGELV